MEASENRELREPLTPRELQVIQLLSEGLSNPAIAQRLFISRGTVKIHVEHIFDKLGVTTRAEAAAWFARNAPKVPEHVGPLAPFLDDLQALIADGERSPTRLMRALQERGYTAKQQPISDYLRPGRKSDR